MKPIPWNAKLWKESVTQFLEFLNPLIAGLGRSERRVAATRYVEGLLMPGQRKSIIPMAERLGVDAQRLQQFVTDSPWKEEELWRAIRQEIIPHLEPLEAWVVDETGWVKQGSHSVGVAHQYCGAVGKQANCQVSVEVVVSDGWIAAPVGGRLYLPERWTADRERCQAAGVPEEVTFATKPELALEILRQARRDGVPPAPVLGDSAYGNNADFRAGVRALEMEFFLQVDGQALKGWDREVRTEVKRVRRYVCDGEPPAATLAELTDAHPRERMEEVRLGDGGRTNPAHASGLARSLSATRFAPSGGRTGKSLAGGGLAGGGPGALSLLLGPPPPSPHQSPLLETEPLPLAYRTILPTLQG